MRFAYRTAVVIACRRDEANFRCLTGRFWIGNLKISSSISIVQQQDTYLRPPTELNAILTSLFFFTSESVCSRDSTFFSTFSYRGPCWCLEEILWLLIGFLWSDFREGVRSNHTQTLFPCRSLLFLTHCTAFLHERLTFSSFINYYEHSVRLFVSIVIKHRYIRARLDL